MTSTVLMPGLVRPIRIDRSNAFPRSSIIKRRPERSVCHQHWQFCVAQDVAGGAAEDHLPQSTLIRRSQPNAFAWARITSPVRRPSRPTVNGFAGTSFNCR